MGFTYRVLSEFRQQLKKNKKVLDVSVWNKKLTNEYYRSYFYHHRATIISAFVGVALFSAASLGTMASLLQSSLLTLTASTIASMGAVALIPTLIAMFAYFVIRDSALFDHMNRCATWEQHHYQSDDASEQDQLVGVLLANDLYLSDAYESTAGYQDWKRKSQGRAGDDPGDYVRVNAAKGANVVRTLDSSPPKRRKNNGIVIQEPSAKPRSRSSVSSSTENTEDFVDLIPLDEFEEKSCVTSPRAMLQKPSDVSRFFVHTNEEDQKPIPVKSADDLFFEEHDAKVEAARAALNRCFNHRAQDHNEKYVNFAKAWGIYNAWNQHNRNRGHNPTPFPSDAGYFDNLLVRLGAQRSVSDEDLQMFNDFKRYAQEYNVLLMNERYKTILNQRGREENMRNNTGSGSVLDQRTTTPYSFL